MLTRILCYAAVALMAMASSAGAQQVSGAPNQRGAAAERAALPPNDPRSPKFHQWCSRSMGSYQNDKSFALREAAGCYSNQHSNRLH